MGRKSDTVKGMKQSLQRIARNRKKFTKSALALISQGHATLASMQHLVITVDDATDNVITNVQKFSAGVNDLVNSTNDDKIIDLDENGYQQK